MCFDFRTPNISGKVHKKMVPVFASKEWVMDSVFFIIHALLYLLNF